MKSKIIKKIILTLGCMILIFSLIGCTSSKENTTETSTADTTSTESSTTSSTSKATGILDISTLLSERDLEQTADLTDAKTITLVSGEDVTITEEGVYIISGNVENSTIIVEAPEDVKVQLVLDGVSITNEDSPAIYVKEADKVFVTTTDSENSMEVTGAFTVDGDTNLDAVIFSKSDLVLNGTGTLKITCAQGNGVTSKDDLKVTGGTYTITTAGDGIEANDYVVIYDGDFTFESGKDAVHSENEDDNSLGSIYIANGTLTITADDDGIQGTSIVQIDGGTINIKSCVEGIEGTYIQINDGTIDINASDDGINATRKSTSYDVTIELNGGTINIKMGSGDTDAVDSNGDIYVNGGTITIDAVTSSFDFDGTGELNGGNVTVNGETITEMPESQMGGGPMGGGKMR